MSQEEWLELAEAAKILGVHQSTLRRWADHGKIAHIRTLKGRRRFTRESIEAARKDMHQEPQQLRTEQLETRTLDFTRQRSSTIEGKSQAWMENLSDEQRLVFRYSGQRLLGLMMQFISRTDSAGTFLEEGKRVAGDYGRVCYNAGLSISQTAEAFLYFRRSILESVQATAGLGGPYDHDGHRIFLRTIDFFDTLLVATIDSYSNLKLKG